MSTSKFECGDIVRLKGSTREMEVTNPQLEVAHESVENGVLCAWEGEDGEMIEVFHAWSLVLIRRASAA